MNLLFYHISQIVPTGGGVENVTYYWYRYFRSKGYQVSVLFWQPREGAPDDMIQVQLPDSRHYYSEVNKAFFREYLKEHKIDVVINQNGVNNKSSLTCVEACASVQVPVVSVLHNSPDHYLWDFSWGRKCMRYGWGRKLLSFCYFLLQRFPGYKGGYYVYRKSTRIVVLSPRYIRSYIRLNAGNDRANKVMAFFNPLTLSVRPLAGGAEPVRNVLLVGRLEKQKAVEYMLAIWQQVEAEHPLWQLYILGDGSQADALKKKAAEWKLSHVHFVGNTPPEPYYAQASVLCLTSLYEGLPMVLLESRSYGLVPLCFDTFAAASDLIKDGYDGFLIPPFDCEEYAKRLSFLMDNPSPLARMRQASVNRAMDFDAQKIGEGWMNLLESLARNTGSSEKT